MVGQTASKRERRILADCVKPGRGPVPQFHRAQFCLPSKTQTHQKNTKIQSCSWKSFSCLFFVNKVYVFKYTFSQAPYRWWLEMIYTTLDYDQYCQTLKYSLSVPWCIHWKTLTALHKESMTLRVLWVRVSWYPTQLLMVNCSQVRVRSLCYVLVHSSFAVLSSPLHCAGVP